MLHARGARSRPGDRHLAPPPPPRQRRERRHGHGAGDHLAHNYHPLPVVLTGGENAWVHDADGREYLDLLAGYSALNFGHRHPALVAAAHAQLDRITLTSRAFDHDLLHPFADRLAALTGPRWSCR